MTPALEQLGLRRGEKVRWRPRPDARPVEGTVTGRERDGSVGVVDPQGRARAFAIDRLEVRCTGPRGGRGWEPLSERAARTEQLGLFS